MPAATALAILAIEKLYPCAAVYQLSLFFESRNKYTAFRITQNYRKQNQNENMAILVQYSDSIKNTKNPSSCIPTTLTKVFIREKWIAGGMKMGRLNRYDDGAKKEQAGVNPDLLFLFFLVGTRGFEPRTP